MESKDNQNENIQPENDINALTKHIIETLQKLERMQKAETFKPIEVLRPILNKSCEPIVEYYEIEEGGSRLHLNEEPKNSNAEKQEFENEPIPDTCTCRKMYNWYVQGHCDCTEDMKKRNKVCVNCHTTQFRSCHRNCANSCQDLPEYYVAYM